MGLAGYEPFDYSRTRTVQNYLLSLRASHRKSAERLLVFYEVGFPRTHDLVELCKLCIEIDLRYYEILEDCPGLTGYGTQMRYHSGIEVDETEMREALAACGVVMDFIESSLDFEQEQGSQMSM